MQQNFLTVTVANMLISINSIHDSFEWQEFFPTTKTITILWWYRSTSCSLCSSNCCHAMPSNQTHSSLAPSQSSRLTKDTKLFLVQLEKSNRSRRATVFCCKIYLLFSTGLFLCASGTQLLANLYRFDSKLNGVTGIFHVMEECQRILECCRLISYFLESLTLRVIKI